MILSLMSHDALIREARETRFPKWNTLCLLRSLGLPTLDAVFIPLKQITNTSRHRRRGRARSREPCGGMAQGARSYGPLGALAEGYTACRHPGLVRRCVSCRRPALPAAPVERFWAQWVGPVGLSVRVLGRCGGRSEVDDGQLRSTEQRAAGEARRLTPSPAR